MRPILSACRLVVANADMPKAAKLKALRAILFAAKPVSLFSRADLPLVDRLNEMAFRYSDAVLDAHPGYYYLVEAALATEAPGLFVTTPSAVYDKILEHALARRDLTRELKLALIEALNVWIRSHFVNNGGTVKIPNQGWHIFENVRPFRETPEIPFSAFEDIVDEAFTLAHESLEDPTIAYPELPGYREFMNHLEARKWELVPSYPALQNYYLGGH